MSTMSTHNSSTGWTLTPGKMTMADLRAVWAAPARLTLSPDAYPVIEASAAAVQAIVAKGDAAYGINTGFGILAKTRIPDEKLEELQRNLILSHSVGTGELLSDAVCRLIMLMKIGSLARVLVHDSGSGVMRHADAGYETAVACAKRNNLNLPMVK